MHMQCLQCFYLKKGCPGIRRSHNKKEAPKYEGGPKKSRRSLNSCLNAMGGNFNQGRKSLIITCSQSLNHRMYSPLSHVKHDQIFQGDVFASQECILVQSFKVKLTLFHLMFLCDSKISLELI